MATAERRPEFVLTYDGEALQAHRMAVADLAPALLALGEIFHEANEASDPNAPRVSLEIRAFDSGSFDVTLSLPRLVWVRISCTSLPVRTPTRSST